MNIYKVHDHIIFFAGFTTNKTELNAVFDIFDKDNKYYMEYSEFIEALKPDRHVSLCVW